MNKEYNNWTGSRNPKWLATNFQSPILPFQNWQRFKEAFAPEIVAQAIKDSPLDVRTVLDPFGGSGTSALTAQFLGCTPTTCEVNPYLADVIESKLQSYDPVQLEKAKTEFLARAQSLLENAPEASSSGLPATFVEPGRNGRWIFSRTLFNYLSAVIEAAASFDPPIARLFRTSIGGDLVALSNARVSGKGRRYRNHWSAKQQSNENALELISESVRQAVSDITEHGTRPESNYTLLRGDSRALMAEIDHADLVIFSPPYPNSFDYTDVYNIELWALGYLTTNRNRELRVQTLSSHVQINRSFSPPPDGSPTLASTIHKLSAPTRKLWNGNIPAMIGGYFHDMRTIMRESLRILPSRGQAWMVVGDSRYDGVDVPVAQILSELADTDGWIVRKNNPIRSMRTAPQQGGRAELPESLIVIERQ